MITCSFVPRLLEEQGRSIYNFSYYNQVWKQYCAYECMCKPSWSVYLLTKKNEMTNCHKKRNGYAKQLINGGVGHVHVVTYYLRYETIKSSVVLWMSFYHPKKMLKCIFGYIIWKMYYLKSLKSWKHLNWNML